MSTVRPLEAHRTVGETIVRRLAPWQSYLAVSAVLVVGYLATPALIAQIPVYALVALSSSVVTVLGVRRYRPREPGAWWLIALAHLLFAIGEIGYEVQTLVRHQDVFPSWCDGFYLASYPVLVAGLVRLIRARRPGNDRPGLLDALILSVGAAMLAWVFVMVPYVRDTESTLAAQAVSLAYPISDLFVLGVLLRLANGSAGRRTPAERLLIGSTVALLLGDTVYSLLQATGGYEVGGLLDVTWLAMFVLSGAAALHPTMVQLSERSLEAPDTSVPLRRLVALGGASLMGPAVLAVEAWRGMAIDVPVIVGGCAVLFLLVIARLHGLVVLVSEALRVVEHQATHDQLTGLANRRRFHDDWSATLTSAGGPSALLYIDLDGFKGVNDGLGHEAGDTLLCLVADRLREAVRAGDVVARIGGDEFAVILPWTDPVDAGVVAARIVAGIGAPFDLPGRTVSIGASVGQVDAPPGADPAETLHRADQAMYVAKTTGRGRVHAG